MATARGPRVESAVLPMTVERSVAGRDEARTQTRAGHCGVRLGASGDTGAESENQEVAFVWTCRRADVVPQIRRRSQHRQKVLRRDEEHSLRMRVTSSFLDANCPAGSPDDLTAASARSRLASV